MIFTTWDSTVFRRLWIRSVVIGRWEPIFFNFMAMALASKGPIQMGSPVLFDRSIRRTTNPFDVESKVKNFTFISTNIPLLLSLTNSGDRFPPALKGQHLSPGGYPIEALIISRGLCPWGHL